MYFYERRARRILPAVFFVVLVSFPIAYLTLLPGDFRDFGWSLVGVATFTSNFVFWQQSDYFATAAELTPLLHTWSLAVEEQFYIFFPILLMIIYRIRKNAALLAIIVLTALSFTLSYSGTYSKPVATFYFLPTRAWELLIGSIAAIYLHQGNLSVSRGISNTLSTLGLAAIVFAIFSFDKSTPFPGFAALIPTLGTLAIILFAIPGTVAHALLSWKIFTGIGLISYSLYLWHQPVFAFYKNYAYEVSNLEYFACIVITFLLAIFSYYCIETPFRQKKDFFTRRRILSASCVGIVAIALIGVYSPRVLPNPSQKMPSSEVSRNYEPSRRVLADDSWSILQGLYQQPSVEVAGDPYERNFSFRDDDDRHAMLLVGNSHSKDFFNVLSFSDVAHEHFQIARFGTQLSDISDDFFETPNYLRSDIVVLASRYTTADIEAFDRLAARTEEDGKIVVLVPNIYEFFDSGRYTLADRMVLDFFEEERYDYKLFAEEVGHAFLSDYESGEETSKHRLTLQMMQEIEDRATNVVVLDRMDYVCETHICYALNDQLEKYFFDYGHHTLAGARFFATRVDEIGWLDPVIDLLHHEN